MFFTVIFVHKKGCECSCPLRNMIYEGMHVLIATLLFNILYDINPPFELCTTDS